MADLADLDRRWQFMLRAYYTDDVPPPKTPGDLAIETVHADRVGMEMERRIMQDRADIGEIVLIER